MLLCLASLSIPPMQTRHNVASCCKQTRIQPIKAPAFQQSVCSVVVSTKLEVSSFLAFVAAVIVQSGIDAAVRTYQGAMTLSEVVVIPPSPSLPCVPSSCLASGAYFVSFAGLVAWVGVLGMNGDRPGDDPKGKNASVEVRREGEGTGGSGKRDGSAVVGHQRGQGRLKLLRIFLVVKRACCVFSFCVGVFFCCLWWSSGGVAAVLL